MALWWLLPAALGVARVQERQDPHSGLLERLEGLRPGKRQP